MLNLTPCSLVSFLHEVRSHSVGGLGRSRHLHCGHWFDSQRVDSIYLIRIPTLAVLIRLAVVSVVFSDLSPKSASLRAIRSSLYLPWGPVVLMTDLSLSLYLLLDSGLLCTFFSAS